MEWFLIGVAVAGEIVVVGEVGGGGVVVRQLISFLPSCVACGSTSATRSYQAPSAAAGRHQDYVKFCLNGDFRKFGTE